MTLTLVLVALVVFGLWTAKALLESRAPVPWSDAEELEAREVARMFGVSLETARLVIIAGRQ